MGQYITLIFADEKMEIGNKEIPHFYEDGYLIIPYNNESRYAVEELQDVCKEGMTLDELFNLYIDKTFSVDEDEKNDILEKNIELYYTDLDDLEEIYLVEFLKLLNLPDFLVFSYDDLGGDYYLYFENFVYQNSDRNYNKFKMRMDKPYLYSYGGCKNHCLKEMKARINNLNI